MTSKNSFWASLIENNKRRIWVWLLSAFSYMVLLPAVLAMAISQKLTGKEYLIESLGEELARQTMREQAVGVVQGFLGVSNIFLMFLAAGFAILSAIQGFSYLYSRKKIDFYMGMPVKRSRRFMIIWLNGILIYLFPCLFGLLISCLIAVLNGAMTASVAGTAALSYVLFFAFYLGVYHMAVLAVMLTGNVIITCLGTAVFLLYEWAVRATIQSYESKFFRFFSYWGSAISPRLSPFTMLAEFAQKQAKGQGSVILTLFYLLLFAGILWLAAYFCYLKRPAEAAGRAMAFRQLQPFIKILLVVPAALLSGMVVGEIVNYRPIQGAGNVGFVIFTIAVVTVAASCLIQVLYEFDIMGLIHKKHHILISAVLAAAVFLIFRLDVFGFDSYIPAVESVSSAALVPPYEYRYYGETYFDEDLEPISKTKYAEENMYLTDVGAVNKLMKLSLEELEEYEDLSQLYGGAGEEEGREWYAVTVLFRMNNKRNVYRDIYVDVKNPEVAELLDRIEGSREYISGIYSGASESLAEILADENNSISTFYGNNIYENKLSRQEANELLALYREDIMDTSFSAMRESIPVGSLRFSIEKEYPLYSTYYNMEVTIYPFFSGCVDYLKEHGYYMDLHLDPEDVEKIQITNYNYGISAEQQKRWQEEQAAGGAKAETAESVSWDGTDYWRYISVDREDEIQEICGALYPQEWLRRSFHMDTQEDEDYSVTVYFKSGSMAAKENGSVGNYSFKEGEVPQFIVDATAYQE